jgi:hypothetical protein
MTTEERKYIETPEKKMRKIAHNLSTTRTVNPIDSKSAKNENIGKKPPMPHPMFPPKFIFASQSNDIR